MHLETSRKLFWVRNINHTSKIAETFIGGAGSLEPQRHANASVASRHPLSLAAGQCRCGCITVTPMLMVYTTHDLHPPTPPLCSNIRLFICFVLCDQNYDF